MTKLSNYLKISKFDRKISKKPFNLTGWDKISSYLFVKKEVLSFQYLTNFSTIYKRSITNKFDLTDIVFFDTETTGLSGGAGTIIFLFGIAWFENNKVNIEQIFLSDYPGEKKFLEYIINRLKRFKLFTSFNGKSYDSHILKNRLVLNLIDFKIQDQFDLLHISRRFWKKIIGSCSLSDIERNILNIYRKNDLPGYEVPEKYINFLKTKDPKYLWEIFKHNYQDVISLVILFEKIENILSLNYKNIVLDEVNLGLFLIKNNDKRGIDILKKSFLVKKNISAGKHLSIYLKKRKQWDEAIEIWEKMCLNKNIFAAIELSKYYEHRIKQYNTALSWVEVINSWYKFISPIIKKDLLKREKRIIKKIQRQKWKIYND